MPSARAEQFDEADAALHHPPGEQALPAELFGVRIVEPVQLLASLRILLLKIQSVGHLRLHAKRKLVVADRRFDLGDAAEAIEHALVQCSQQIELCRCVAADLRAA